MKKIRFFLLLAAALAAGTLLVKVAAFVGDHTRGPNWQPAAADDPIHQIPR